MRLTEKIQFTCDICGTSYNKEETALECESAGKKFQYLKETLKPYMWYEFKHDSYNEEVILVFPDDIKFNYDCRNESPCLSRRVSLFSIYYNNYFNMRANGLIAVYSMEEAYEKYGILPKFGSSNFDYLKNQDIIDRINALYERRNNELKKRIDDMSIEEIKDRLFNSYKFEPNRYRIHEGDNIEESCYLFHSNHPEIF